MVGHIGRSLIELRIPPDCRFIFAVRGDRQRCFRKDLFEGILLFDQ